MGMIWARRAWQARELGKVLTGFGARAVCVELAACGFDTESPSGLNIAGFGGRLPSAVLVRSMAGGSFEAVTLRLGILHALRENGVPGVNDARAIERCVDKSTTSFLLAPTPTPPPAPPPAPSPSAPPPIAPPPL